MLRLQVDEVGNYLHQPLPHLPHAHVACVWKHDPFHLGYFPEVRSRSVLHSLVILSIDQQGWLLYLVDMRDGAPSF